MTNKDFKAHHEPDENSDVSEELYERLNLIVDRGQEPMRLDKFLEIGRASCRERVFGYV